jgi:hypothetical protein
MEVGGSKMVRMKVRLREEQLQALKGMAQEQGVSVAQLVRQSIDRWLALEERRQALLSIVGIYASGVSDLSTNHDYYLAEAYGTFGKPEDYA